MSSQYSVLSPNYRGIKKFNVLVTVQFVIEADFTDYKGVKLSERMGYLIYGEKFNKLMVQLDGEEALIKVKEAIYSVLGDNYNVGVINALISFDIFANSENEAAEKMRRTLEGNIVINNFTLSDADTSNMDFNCNVLSYQFDSNYLVKEVTKYDETPKKYEQLASLKVIVKGHIPECFHELYESDSLCDNDIYKFEGFTMTIDGLRKIDYKLLPISFKALEDGLAEFYFAFNFFNINGYSPDHASDVFESIFTPDNTTISDFTFIDDENFITTKLEVISITDAAVEEVAQ